MASLTNQVVVITRKFALKLTHLEQQSFLVSNTFLLHWNPCASLALACPFSPWAANWAQWWDPAKEAELLTMNLPCPEADLVLPGADWLLLSSFPCVCYGSVPTWEGNNSNVTRIKGERALYSEEGDAAMLPGKREATHLPAKGQWSTHLLQQSALQGSQAWLVPNLSLFYQALDCCSLFLWPKVCRMGLAAPKDHISVAKWPDFPSHLPQPTSWLLMRPINRQLELNPDKPPEAHCLADCGVNRTSSSVIKNGPSSAL